MVLSSKPQPGSDDANAQLLRFCTMVIETAQTPDLINQVAEDAVYVRLCRQVAAGDTKFQARFQAVCNWHQFNASLIRRRLQPVARALRIDRQENCVLDYYEVLGVSADADDQTIKSAFRRKAHMLHPDKQDSGSGDGQAFIELQAAYVNLSDPELRGRHDREHRPDESWVETSGVSHPPTGKGSPARKFRFAQLCILIGALGTVLVIVSLILER